MNLSDGRRVRVLFLCTGNSCRSQMAEGWARALRGDVIEAYSAGIAPQGLNPMAVRVMAEAGVDISVHASKRPQEIGIEFDYVVTVCDSAHESCPVFAARTRVVHVGFDDPPRLARGAASDEEAMGHYRRVRDEIRRFVEALPGALRAPVKSTHTEGSMTMNDATKSKTDGGCCGPSCCGGAKGEPAQTTSAAVASATTDPHAVRDIVREGYAKIARSGTWNAAKVEAQRVASGGCCGGAPAGSVGAKGGGCCGPSTFTPDQLAQAIGYSQQELGAMPEGANMGLSCGNPTALASLKPGETVLDLGSGGGFDCFIAGPKVGAAGRVIGVDMTPDMLAKARGNIASYKEQTGLSNVEFRLGEIENIPVADASVDVVISNCVLNLSPDKARVWKEIARVLKPGGRVAISDLVLLKALPAEVQRDVEAVVGCVAGASVVGVMENMARKAGLTDIRIERKPGYVDAMTDWQDPLYRAIIARLGRGERIGDYVTSADIRARKP